MNEVDPKFKDFIEITRTLNGWGIEPIPYGSLGLNHCLGEIVTPVEDVDILIPADYLAMPQRWLADLGYQFRSRGRHELRFSKDETEITFASEHCLFDIPNFWMRDLRFDEEQGVSFRQLHPQHYLDLYTFLLTCDYRQNKRQADLVRIEAIKRFLESK